MHYPNEQALAFGVIKESNAANITPNDVDVIAKCTFTYLCCRCC